MLCFLAGAAEIRRAAAEVAPIAAAHSADVVPLHGGLSADEQDDALKEVSRRRVILATNIAETSLTVPGVRAVVDTGLHKVARYDPARAIDSLEIERIPQDSADQRAGRAGRVAAGAVWRLWNAADRLRPRAQAEIHRIDLAAVVLAVLSWGGDPYSLGWFEAPARYSLDAAFELLRGLGRRERLAHHRDRARRCSACRSIRGWRGFCWPPAAPSEAALACAVLSERHYASAASHASSNDLLTIVENPHGAARAHHARRAAALVAGGEDGLRASTSAAFGARCLPVTRTASRGGVRRDRRKCCSRPATARTSAPRAACGTGSSWSPSTSRRRRRERRSEARIRMAAIVDREWLEPTDVRLEHVFDETSATVRAMEREYYGAVVLSERIVPPSEDAAASMLADVYVQRRLGADDQQLLRRLRFAGIDVDVAGLVRAAAYGKRSLDDIQIADALTWEQRSQLERDAPARLPLPSGRSAPLEYREDGSVVASVKLQEMFGVLETPTIGGRQEPVLLALLAPNGRPVQLTRDLRSFWERTYPEVRKELRGRYPKHKWPEKPE